MKLRWVTLTALLAVGTFINKEDCTAQATDSVVALNAQAVKAYQAKDYKRFLELEKQALAVDPKNPRVLYNVACGESLNGNTKEAVRLLSLLAARKLDLGAETDGDFAAIRNTEEWAGFEAKLAELRKPIVRGEVAFRLDDPQLVATGLAYDASTGDVYVASVRERKILRRTRDGKVSDFTHEEQDGFLAGAFLGIDAPRQLLYASTGAVPFMRGYRKEDRDRSGVFAFDLKTGKTARKAWVPADGKHHFLNALVVDRGGDVYVSDSANSGIYRLRRGKDDLEVLVPSTMFEATQGLAFSEDEKTLFVADYSDGLWAVDMATKARRKIEAPDDAWLAGLDGLARVKDGFVSVQIGVQPQRVVHLHLDAQWQRVVNVEVLESNHPEYEGPIQGVLADGAFLYVANSQLGLGNGETGAFASEKAKPTVVLRLGL